MGMFSVSLALLSLIPLPGAASRITIIEGVPVVPILINGKIQRMLLDTGSAVTLIDEEAARPLNIQDREPLQASIGAIKLSLQPRVFKLGHIEFVNEKMPAGEKVIGVLGIDSLKEFYVGLDFQDGYIAIWQKSVHFGSLLEMWRSMRISPPRTTSGYGIISPGTQVFSDGQAVHGYEKRGLPLTAYPLKFDKELGLILVPVMVEEQSLWAVLDSGARMATVPNLAPFTTLQSEGKVVLLGPFRQALGDYIRIPQFGLPNSQPGELLAVRRPSTELPFILGMNVLSRYRWLLDIEAGIIFASPAQAPIGPSGLRGAPKDQQGRPGMAQSG